MLCKSGVRRDDSLVLGLKFCPCSNSYVEVIIPRAQIVTSFGIRVIVVVIRRDPTGVKGCANPTRKRGIWT